MNQSWRLRASALRARMPRPAGALHRARDARLGAYRAFGKQRGWQVLGLYEDLSHRYPVAPLLGAHSAQAELALTGHWSDWNALVASVLVLPHNKDQRQGRHTSDLVVQLTMLDTGPDPRQFTASVTADQTEVVPITPAAEAAVPDLEAFLRKATGTGALRPGDNLAATEIEMLHARVLDPLTHQIDLYGPVKLLARLARSFV